MQIYHAKSFKMRHFTSLYFNFSVWYSKNALKIQYYHLDAPLTYSLWRFLTRILEEFHGNLLFPKDRFDITRQYQNSTWILLGIKQMTMEFFNNSNWNSGQKCSQAWVCGVSIKKNQMLGMTYPLGGHFGLSQRQWTTLIWGEKPGQTILSPPCYSSH